jgi:hypothetical protein
VAALFFLLAHKGEGFAVGDCRSPVENPRRALSFDTKCRKSYSVTFDKSNKTEYIETERWWLKWEEYLCHRAKEVNYIIGEIMRRLEKEGYTNIITREFSELDLCNQAQVESFFEVEKPQSKYPNFHRMKDPEVLTSKGVKPKPESFIKISNAETRESVLAKKKIRNKENREKEQMEKLKAENVDTITPEM